MSPVHRTSHFSEDQVNHLRENAARQERIIARIFWKNPDLKYAPSQIQTIVNSNGEQWPITSTRRAITNLCDADILQKTDHKIKGPQGRPEHCWQWKRPHERPAQQASMFDEPSTKHRNMTTEPM